MINNLKKYKNPYTFFGALKSKNIVVLLSFLIMGLSNIVYGQVVKGLLFLLIEIALTIFMLMPGGGYSMIFALRDLGHKVPEEIWNEDKGIYEYTQGDRSQLILLYGVASIAIAVIFVLIWRVSVVSGYKAYCDKKEGRAVNGIRGDLRALFDEKIERLLMTPPTAFLLVFTILPLLYMMCMAFTDYSRENNKLILFDWVGLRNFASVFNSGSVIGSQFWGVLLWTLIWAFFATFLNFIFGTLVAMLINREATKCKGLWRTLLSVTIAAPQFVSLLVVRSMLLPDGIINRLLISGGLIDSRLPFFEDALWARSIVIIVNLWIGIPYTILQVTGVLNNIPKQLYDATKVDGCTKLQTFIHVTVPYMLFVMTPYLITQFTGNVNNFNVIYLLTRGEPIFVGNSAGETDLLITWLYKLSVSEQKYNLAAVVGILTFVVLSVVALISYRNTAAYKNEEGFS